MTDDYPQLVAILPKGLPLDLFAAMCVDNPEGWELMVTVGKDDEAARIVARRMDPKADSNQTKET